jgi:hypothetical protein
LLGSNSLFDCFFDWAEFRVLNLCYCNGRLRYMIELTPWIMWYQIHITFNESQFQPYITKVQQDKRQTKVERKSAYLIGENLISKRIMNAVAAS